MSSFCSSPNKTKQSFISTDDIRFYKHQSMLYITELREICHNQSYMDRNRVSDLQSLMEVTTNITTDLEDELSKEKFQVTDKQIYARPLKEMFFHLWLLLGIAVFLQVVILVLSFCE